MIRLALEVKVSLFCPVEAAELDAGGDTLEFSDAMINEVDAFWERRILNQ